MKIDCIVIGFQKINTKIAIIGLGYVGLPLAVEFGKVFDTVGFDINQSRIDEFIEKSNDKNTPIIPVSSKRNNEK